MVGGTYRCLLQAEAVWKRSRGIVEEGHGYSKLGRRVVYRPEDLEAWIVANRFQSTSEYPGKQG